MYSTVRSNPSVRTRRRGFQHGVGQTMDVNEDISTRCTPCITRRRGFRDGVGQTMDFNENIRAHDSADEIDGNNNIYDRAENCK